MTPMPLHTAQSNIARHISEQGTVRHGRLMAALSSTQRPFLAQVINEFERIGYVRVEGEWPTHYVWTGPPPEPTEPSSFNDGDPNTYPAVHHRLWRNRGRAAEQECAWHCGRRANQWAYDHHDPDEVTGPTKTGRTDDRAYSLDLAHYLPLCYWCHVRLDNPGVA